MRKKIIVILLIGIYTLAGILVSLNRHWQYQTFYYDLGIYDQTIWRMSKGLIPPVIDQLGINGLPSFADHFNPSFILLAPIFWISQRTEALLVFQGLAVGLSLGIAYTLVKRFVHHHLLGLALLASYGGFVGLQNAVITDFHDTTVAVFPLMLLFWAIYSQRWKWYFSFLLIVLGFKESMAGLGVGIGLFLIFRKQRNIRMGLLTIILSLVWGITATKFLIPYYSGGSFAYNPKIPSSLFILISKMFSPFIKLRTLIVSFTTFGFLPLASLSMYPLYFEHFLERFVLQEAGTRWDLGMHYNALLSPILFIGALETIIFFQKKRLNFKYYSLLAILLIFFTSFFHWKLRGPLTLSFRPIFYAHTKEFDFLNKFIEKIPKQGLLMTQNNLASHFSHQEVILLRKDYNSFKLAIIAVDLREGQNPNNFFPLSEEEAKILITGISTDSSYVKIPGVTKDQFLFIKVKI